jgi:hypothetical protein
MRTAQRPVRRAHILAVFVDSHQTSVTLRQVNAANLPMV